jgi:hypothetical protein
VAQNVSILETKVGLKAPLKALEDSLGAAFIQSMHVRESLTMQSYWPHPAMREGEDRILLCMNSWFMKQMKARGTHMCQGRCTHTLDLGELSPLEVFWPAEHAALLSMDNAPQL